MTDELPIPIVASALTPERRERLAAARDAMQHLVTFARQGLDACPLPEDTAKLIALPLDQRSDIEAIMRAANATRIRCSGALKAHASGHSVSANEAAVSRQKERAP